MDDARERLACEARSTMVTNASARGARARKLRRVAGTLAAATVVMGALSGCGNEGGSGSAGPTALPSITRSTTRSALPSVTRSVEGSSPAASPTETSQAPETSSPPAEASPTSSPTEESGPSAEPAESAADSTAFWWVLGLLVVVGTLVGIVLARRRRRQQTQWSSGLAERLADATWLSQDLIPNLLGQRAEGRAGVWAIGRPRVLRLEQALGAVARDAPDDATARQVTTLSSAVEALRSAFDRWESAGLLGGDATTMALRQSQRDLDDAIAALKSDSGA